MMKKIIWFIAIMLVVCVPANLFAQKGIEITGIITGDDLTPVVGASVVEKGTTNGTSTDFEGKYKLKLTTTKNAILVYSFIGTVKQEVLYKGVDVINVVLKSNITELDEVVAIGYGTVKRRDLTGAVSSVSGDEIARIPVSNVADALTGKIAGVSVATTSGAPEADIVVRIRGGISVTQDNSPLYIVDGFPTENGLIGLSPTDIESIDVLKDASSTAIYGSRGANGVVIITTNRGKEGRNLVNYEMYYGVKMPSKSIPVLSPLEFVLFDYEKQGGTDEWNATYGPIQNAVENYGNRSGIDWQNKLLSGRLATSQLHKLSFNGGNSVATYNLSYNYNKDDGILPGSGVGKHTVRLSFDYKISEKFKFGTNISYYKEAVDGTADYLESANNTFFQNLFLYKPTVGINGDDRNLLLDSNEQDGGEIDDPVTKLQSQIKKYSRTKSTYNVIMTYTFNKDLVYNAALGLNSYQNDNSIFYTSISSQAKLSNGPFGTLNQSLSEEYFGNQTLMFKKAFKKDHKLDLLIGNEIRMTKFKSVGVSAGGFPEDNFGIDYFNVATIAMLPTSNKESSHLLSFFGRANYSYKYKYLFNASIRADGSTKFGVNNKWGYFPAAGFAWKANEEKFIKDLKIFSNLKLRATYGWTGNNNIGNYRSLAIYSANWTPINNSGYTVFNPSLSNSNLRWEINKSANFGLDIGVLKNRINATVEWYDNRSKDLLLEAKIPYTTGFSTALRNIGSTSSRGFEITLQSNNIQTTDFTWSTNINVAFNKLKVLKLADSDRWEINSMSSGDNKSTYDYVIEVGRSTGLMWGYIYDGLYQTSDFTWNATTGWTLKPGIPVSSISTQKPAPGVSKFKDISGDGVITLADQGFIGNANPKCSGGIMNSLRYKKFDFSFFCEFKLGGDIYNGNLYKLLNTGKNVSTTKYVYDKQYKSIDESGTALLTTGAIQKLDEININAVFPSQSAGVVPFSSMFIEKGDYLRISQVTMGYTVPADILKKVKIKNLRIYGTAYNLLTITNYSGYDPDVSMNRQGGLTPGIDKGSYPRSISCVMGANISF